MYIAAEHEEARRRDQADLASTLERLQNNDNNILESLELRGDQLMEAVRGLRDVSLHHCHYHCSSLYLIELYRTSRHFGEASTTQFRGDLPHQACKHFLRDKLHLTLPNLHLMIGRYHPSRSWSRGRSWEQVPLVLFTLDDGKAQGLL